ncbi:palmitoyltransferase ZDHHC22 isoform X2 [Gambusia affinis]|uniref:palmitoyltransferase ZDHHC22 isoform X2 n=1 Tax=Gambusia affinis TaxID=33528 RepID=UPI001CDCFDF8|nr:palmitoyltransferase ZDHHC22 isoform X2 [Gambusia affinis]
MFTRMLKLRLLNAVAPAYFFAATTVTFILHFCLFIPTIFPNPDTSLKISTALHTTVFLFLMFNALGNYIMTIKYPAESDNEIAIPVCSPSCSDKVDSHYLLNGRHFCKLCRKVIFRRDHHCFFTGNCIGNKNMRYFIMFCIYTSCVCMYSLVLGVAFLTVEYSISFENPLTFLTLLPLSTTYFFMGFCCQQVLLVARGQTWCQMQRGELVDNRSPWRANLKDVFGARWILGLILPVQTVEMYSEDTDELKQD